MTGSVVSFQITECSRSLTWDTKQKKDHCHCISKLLCIICFHNHGENIYKQRKNNNTFHSRSQRERQRMVAVPQSGSAPSTALLTNHPLIGTIVRCSNFRTLKACSEPFEFKILRVQHAFLGDPSLWTLIPLKDHCMSGSTSMRQTLNDKSTHNPMHDFSWAWNSVLCANQEWTPRRGTTIFEHLLTSKKKTNKTMSWAFKNKLGIGLSCNLWFPM